MKPWHTNLAALALLVVVALGVRIASGHGPFLDTVLGFISLIWAAQGAALWWSARQQRPAPTFTSKHLFSLWAAAMYPLIATSSPALKFPDWFVVASVPIGFLMAYALIAAMVGITRWQFELLSRMRGKKI